jgi:hypothetical protein
MSKQTAVEWLEEQYYESEGKLTRHDFEQARQMEKEQIEETYNQACLDAFRDDNKYGKDYYNETYGGTK